jgi:4-coumarate--CoA ligase
MIKVKEIQVAPAELEDLLLGHPKVDDCAVIGIPDDYGGERPFGFVVLKDGIPESKGLVEELVENVKKKKARTKWLAGVKLVGQIPKSASGKILRRVLRDRLKTEVIDLKAKL